MAAIVNPSPKQKFLGLKHCVDQHRELLQRPDLNTSVDMALQQYQWEVCGGNILQDTMTANGNSAAASYYKLLGAHEFLRTFRLLAEQPKIPPKDSTGEISHEFK